MSDQAVGAFVVFGLIGFGLFVGTLVRASVGMALTAILFGIGGLVIFSTAKSAMQEIVGAIFIVGSALSFGVAGISRQFERAFALLAPNSLGQKSNPPTERLKRTGWDDPKL